MTDLHNLRPRRDDTDDSLIPLINIVFLLLIFFMIAGQINPDEHSEITPPLAESEKDVRPTDKLISQDQHGQLYLDGQALTLQTLKASADESWKVTLKSDARTNAAALSPVLIALRESRVQSIHLLALQATP